MIMTTMAFPSIIKNTCLIQAHLPSLKQCPHMGTPNPHTFLFTFIEISWQLFLFNSASIFPANFSPKLLKAPDVTSIDCGQRSHLLKYQSGLKVKEVKIKLKVKWKLEEVKVKWKVKVEGLWPAEPPAKISIWVESEISEN